MSFSIRNLSTYDELLQIHRLQQEIWGLDDPHFGLYPPLMNTATKNGGVALGAFDDLTGEMIAFLFGFLGRSGNGPLKLCSQAMGVRQAWRKRGVAAALKQAQRQHVIQQGLPLITWTYDPLEGPNAHLNLHKLRAISRTYWCDVYGSNLGALNAGLPTDRLVVEWWVQGPRLESNVAATIEDAALIFEVEGQGLHRKVSRYRDDLTTSTLLLESVADVHAVKAADMGLALDWRLKVRAAFETYFKRGYIATHFISQVNPNTGERRNRYLLQQSTPKLMADIGIIE